MSKQVLYVSFRGRLSQAVFVRVVAIHDARCAFPSRAHPRLRRCLLPAALCKRDSFVLDVLLRRSEPARPSPIALLALLLDLARSRAVYPSSLRSLASSHVLP
jgi:hypothetical protein